MVLLGLACALAGPAHGQRNKNGSVYSRFGLGELRTFGSSQTQAMGGYGFALSSLRLASSSNPAATGDQLLTWVAAGAAYETLASIDETDERAEVGFGTLDHVLFSFPILSRRLGFSAVFSPYTRVGYRISQTGELPPVGPGQDAAEYQIDYNGGGGLQRIDLGLGLKATEFLSVGASLNFVFGILEEFQEVRFADAAFTDTRLSNATRLSGISGTLGFQGRVPNVLREEDEMSAGLVVSLPVSMDGSRVTTVGESLDKDTLSAPVDVDARLPLRLGAGVAYSPDPKWLFLADGLFEQWSAFSSNVPFPGYTPDGDGFDNRLRVSGGVELLPAGNDLFARYLGRIAYRVGFFYDRSYVQPRPGADIRTIGVTGGLSFPTRIPGTRIDINLEVGKRGRAEDGLIRETFYRVGVNVNIGERWFQKRKLG